jgi:hypothetical protein
MHCSRVKLYHTQTLSTHGDVYRSMHTDLSCTTVDQRIMNWPGDSWGRCRPPYGWRVDVVDVHAATAHPGMSRVRAV